MAVISKDLGPVSAYAVAVANGFTGTEAEWEQYIANASTAAQSAAGSATAAASSASAAAQSATAAAASQVAAAGSETEAANYALVAGNHAMAAAASATAAETAETGAETAQAAAEAAQAATEAVAESIPEDYTELTEEVGSLKSAVESVAYLAENLAYITPSINETHYGLTYTNGSAKNALTIYGTASQNGNLSFFNGVNEYGSQASTSPTKNVSAGTYTVYFTGTTMIYYTEATYGDRVQLTSGQTLTVGSGGGCIFFRLASGTNYGTSENPITITLTIIAGADASETPSAIDRVARAANEENAGQIDTTYYHSTSASAFYWKPGIRVNSGFVYSDTDAEKYAAMYSIKRGEYQRIYKGSSITINAGYTCDYAVYDAPSTVSGTKLEGRRSIAAGTTITIANDGYLLLSVSDGTNDISDDAGAMSCAASGLTLNLITDRVKDKIPTLDTESPYFKGDLMSNRANLSGWYEVVNTDYSTHSFGTATTYAEIIALFDALVTADSGYVTKNSIGSGEGTDANGNAYTLYEYTFKPKIKTSTRNKRIVPKILLGGAIHGFEKNSTYALYCMMYDLVHNWTESPLLSELRNHVEFQVVPVCNPWGFDRDERNNVNGVNLNRNFPSKNWELITSGINCSGVTGALDQAETQALAEWMQNNPDMLLYLDVHTNGHYFATSYSAANYLKLSSENMDEYYLRLFAAACRHIEDQTAFLPLEFDNVDPGDGFIGILNMEADGYDDETDETTDTIPGKIKQYVSSYLRLALCFTLELFNGLKSNDETIMTCLSANSIKMSAEILADTIVKILAEYSDA